MVNRRDPDDVDEVPVVRHDDRGGRLLVGEALGDVGRGEHEEEGDSPPVTCRPWKPVVR